jgi:hypothetical protein
MKVSAVFARMRGWQEGMKGGVGVEWGVSSWQDLQNCFNLSFTMVPLPGVGSLLVCQLAKWCSSLVILDNITWSDNISESVALGNLSALLSFSTDD